MSNSMEEQEKRRLIILKGISQDLKPSEIAKQLGVSRWIVLKDLKIMRYKGDPELKEAKKAQEEIQANKQSVASASNDRFQRMTGMTFQEKSFRNMIEFYKPELKKILKSSDQFAAINSLPKTIRRTLIKHGIITEGWHKREITPDAIKYLNIT